MLLTAILVFVTRFIDWQSPTNDSLHPLLLPTMGLIALLSALLIQSFSRRFNVFEVIATTIIVFWLGCVLLPPVIPGHSPRSGLTPAAPRSITPRP
jgi:low temperature requirement protein LtrA